jgi:Fic family protein
MNSYVPPFKITPQIMHNSELIAYEIGRLSGEKLVSQGISLRKSNKIKTMHASLAIEGNTLNIEQMTDIINGKRILGPAKDILEVKNASKLYENLHIFDPLDINDLLQAHHILMKDIINENGIFRTSNVGIFNGQNIEHIAPQAKLVQMLMEQIFSFLEFSKDYSWIIKSCVFHYEFEFIHPFIDGNGRMGRLWQQLLLMKHHQIFEFLPIEVTIKENQKAYYEALSQSDYAGESTPFIEFMLTVILNTLTQYRSSAKPMQNDEESRVFYAKEILQAKLFSRKEYMQIHKDISQATASRDLLHGISKGILVKTGTFNQTTYKFV